MVWCMALLEAGFKLTYGVGCECDAHQGRDSFGIVSLAGGLKWFRGDQGCHKQLGVNFQCFPVFSSAFPPVFQC